ncbi:serine/threonine protein phosphatase [Clostridiaceae bacterium OttesenSCG-928-D20]|nr:serine/threonine protein phosphatase [Clostridiaceae bacterium OttesenSCG-928-D20]
MNFFKKEKKRTHPAAVQIRSGKNHPFSALDNYVPLGGGEISLYRAIREAVPIIDAAIMKLIRLSGGLIISCGDKKAERELKSFLRNVQTGRGQRGIESFIDSYLDSLITCGRAVGEIVTRGNQDIAAIICGNVSDVQIREGDNPLKFELCGRTEKGELMPFPYQNLLLFTPFNPEADSPYGVSLLRSMPFLVDILLKIYNAIGVNWDRIGNVRFAITYKPNSDALDQSYAGERAEQIAKEWSRAMESGRNGMVRDFVAVGDVGISVIGAENQVPDSEVPVRQILEQLISRTGIPPFMLGLVWSSTERMSAQQADLMTSEITAIRRSITLVIEKIAETWLSMHGYACDFEVDWLDINLQDEVEEAKALLYKTQAENLSKAENASIREEEEKPTEEGLGNYEDL